MRALEMVPSMAVTLADDKHRAQDKKTKRIRSEAEMIFSLSLKVRPKRAKALGIMKMTKLDRIFFNASLNARLYERRTGDYRFIVPSGSVPIRSRASADYIGQNAVLDAAYKLIMAEPPGSLPFKANKMVALLRDLFTISDKWHWDELIDRVKADESDHRHLAR
jgi:hypothetical protein